MENKMIKSHNILRKEAFASRLNSPQFQKNYSIPFFTAQNSLTTKSRKAFSIAEAMITMTIVAVIAATIAPLVSKQVKINEMSDVQAKILDKKIEDIKDDVQELNKSKWSLSSTESNITRPSGNVGIGVSTNVNPSAKLHVVTPENENSWMFKIQKGADKLPFSVDNNGIVSVRSLDDSVNTKFNFEDNEGTIRTSISNDGVTIIKPKNAWSVFRIYNVNLNDASTEKKYEYKDAAGEITNTVYSNQGFIVLGHGGIRLNYEEIKNSEFDNTNAGGPVGVFVDGGHRFNINEAGQAVFSFATDDPRGAGNGSAFVVRTCKENCGPDSYASRENIFYVQKDGITTMKQLYVKTSAQISGDLNVSGDIKHKGSSILAMMDAKFAKMDEELTVYKNLVVELQKQNELLSEKVAILEAGVNKPLINEANKLAKSESAQNNLLSKLANFVK